MKSPEGHSLQIKSEARPAPEGYIDIADIAGADSLPRQQLLPLDIPNRWPEELDGRLDRLNLTQEGRRVLLENDIVIFNVLDWPECFSLPADYLQASLGDWRDWLQLNPDTSEARSLLRYHFIDDCDGFFSPGTRRIVIYSSPENPEHQVCRILLHELLHAVYEQLPMTVRRDLCSDFAEFLYANSSHRDLHQRYFSRYGLYESITRSGEVAQQRYETVVDSNLPDNLIRNIRFDRLDGSCWIKEDWMHPAAVEVMLQEAFAYLGSGLSGFATDTLERYWQPYVADRPQVVRQLHYEHLEAGNQVKTETGSYFFRWFFDSGESVPLSDFNEQLSDYLYSVSGHYNFLDRLMSERDWRPNYGKSPFIYSQFKAQANHLRKIQGYLEDDVLRGQERQMVEYALARVTVMLVEAVRRLISELDKETA